MRCTTSSWLSRHPKQQLLTFCMSLSLSTTTSFVKLELEVRLGWMGLPAKSAQILLAYFVSTWSFRVWLRLRTCFQSRISFYSVANEPDVQLIWHFLKTCNIWKRILSLKETSFLCFHFVTSPNSFFLYVCASTHVQRTPRLPVRVKNSEKKKNLSEETQESVRKKFLRKGVRDVWTCTTSFRHDKVAEGVNLFYKFKDWVFTLIEVKKLRILMCRSLF